MWDVRIGAGMAWLLVLRGRSAPRALECSLKAGVPLGARDKARLPSLHPGLSLSVERETENSLYRVTWVAEEAFPWVISQALLGLAWGPPVLQVIELES